MENPPIYLEEVLNSILDKKYILGDPDSWLIGNDENDTVTLDYHDGTEIIEIGIKHIKQYGFDQIRYCVTLNTYDENDEIQTRESIVQHGEYPGSGRITSAKLDQIDRKALKEESEYIDKKPTILRGNANQLITVENKIFERVCHINITHSHYYKGVKVTLETPNLTDIEPFIIMRQFFYGIGDN